MYDATSLDTWHMLKEPPTTARPFYRSRFHTRYGRAGWESTQAFFIRLVETGLLWHLSRAEV